VKASQKIIFVSFVTEILLGAVTIAFVDEMHLVHLVGILSLYYC